MRRSVYLVGPHSAGKTTLANALYQHFSQGNNNGQVHLLQEVARTVMKEEGYEREDIESPKCFDMQKSILRAQFRAEEDALASNASIVISDRTGVDPIMYCKQYSPAPMKNAFLQLLETPEWLHLRLRYSTESSLVVLLHPVKEWRKDDGTRMVSESYEEWLEFADLYSSFLTEQDIPFIQIGKDVLNLQERVLFVLQHMNI